MKLKVEIDLSNAAFEDAPGLEVGAMLRHLAFYMEDEPLDKPDHGGFKDHNGNTTGTWEITE